MKDSPAPPLGAPPAVERTKPQSVAWVLPAFVFAAIIVVLFVFVPKGTSIDYAVFRRTGERFLRGEDLYVEAEFFSVATSRGPFHYAPIAAALFTPLALVPYRVGWLLLNLLSAGVLLAVLRWAARYFRPTPTFLELGLLLAMTAPYYGHLFWLGQVDGLVLGLLVASEAQATRRPLLSGVLWALACALRPPFLVLLVPFLVRRDHWRRIAALVAGLPLWLALGAVRYGLVGGVRQLEAWYRTLQGQAPDLICWEFNQSAFALACTWFGPAGSHRFVLGLACIAAVAVAAGFGAALFAYRVDPMRGSFALTAFALYLGAFLSPLGWNTNLLSALPLASALAFFATARSPRALTPYAMGAAIVVVLLNCADLLLLPLRLWEDTAMTLFSYRQYAIAALVLAASSMTCLLVSARAHHS